MMNTTQWPQELGFMKPVDENLMIIPSSSSAAANNDNSDGFITTRTEKRSNTVLKPSQNNNGNNNNNNNVKDYHQIALNCPRCNSTNTKFCYYNNYSLTQPRYFCKSCRRYWTEGGSLRNVPVGGGSRKNKKSSSTAAHTTQNPNLAYPTFTTADLAVGGAQGRVVGPPYLPAAGQMTAMMSVPPPQPQPEFLTSTAAATGFVFPYSNSNGDHHHHQDGPHILPPTIEFWNGMMGGTSGGSSW